MTTGAAIPVILDCDPGHDDAFAMMLAAAHPGLDLKGITTVSGNGPVDRVTDNALRMCELAGLDGVAVARGADGPLFGDAHSAADIHGESALDGAPLPDPTAPASALTATELMVDIIETSPTPVTLIATAPMTNVAILLREHPQTAAKLAGISFMGGSTERGNTRPYAEFNVWADPEAYEMVLDSGLPLRMVGLNVTHQALVTPEVLTELRAQDTALARTCADLLVFFAETYRTVFDMPEPPLHDPLAVLAVAHPDWMTWRSCRVDVETQGQHTRGASVVDLHGVTGRAPNVEVAMTVDVDRFWRLMLDSVARLGRPGVDTATGR